MGQRQSIVFRQSGERERLGIAAQGRLEVGLVVERFPPEEIGSRGLGRGANIVQELPRDGRKGVSASEIEALILVRFPDILEQPLRRCHRSPIDVLPPPFFQNDEPRSGSDEPHDAERGGQQPIAP